MSRPIADCDLQPGEAADGRGLPGADRADERHLVASLRDLRRSTEDLLTEQRQAACIGGIVDGHWCLVVRPFNGLEGLRNLFSRPKFPQR